MKEVMIIQMEVGAHRRLLFATNVPANSHDEGLLQTTIFNWCGANGYDTKSISINHRSPDGVVFFSLALRNGDTREIIATPTQFIAP